MNRHAPRWGTRWAPAQLVLQGLRVMALGGLGLWACAVAAGAEDAFFRAIKRDDVQVIEQLLQKGFDPNTRNEKGDSGLMAAVREPSLKVFSVLITSPDVQVESRNPQDESALMLAALQGNLALCQQLIARDADVNKPGWTPLHYAATHGHLPVMHLLLSHYAYVDAASPNGSTPLMMAAQYGTPAAVQVLIDAGADPTLKNELNLSAIDFALKAQRLDVMNLLASAIRARQPKERW